MKTTNEKLLAVIAVFLAVAVVGLAALGPETKHDVTPQFGAASRSVTKALAPRSCPKAVIGRGSMGACAPEESSAAPFASFRPGPITYPDLSNNDPCVCAATIKAHGHPLEIDKVNQGTGFIDGWFAPMARDAKAHRLAIGGYDFDQDYTTAEVYVFIKRLKSVGIERGTPNTAPPTLDVEFGAANRAGLEHQLAVLFRVYGRASIYTGGWYWLPHFGCWIPPRVSFWLSGYPTAQILCGLPGSRWVSHQYTDNGFNGRFSADMSTWLKSSAAFDSFIQRTPPLTPAQRRAKLRSALAKARRERAELHRDIDSHRCRRGQHNLPREPVRLRLRYHRLCGRWIGLGKARIKTIHSLEKQLR